jgi:hypothetical protein
MRDDDADKAPVLVVEPLTESQSVRPRKGVSRG